MLLANTGASTTRPFPSFSATRTTSPATTEPPSATSATSSCSTSPAAAFDQNAAEDLFVRAKLEDAALSATDEHTRAAVVRLGNNLIDNFEEELVRSTPSTLNAIPVPHRSLWSSTPVTRPRAAGLPSTSRPTPTRGQFPLFQQHPEIAFLDKRRHCAAPRLRA